MGLSFSEHELVASICRESFWAFVKEFWDEAVKETLVVNWHMVYWCRELQRIAERVFKNQPKEYDLVGNFPPGTSKSMLTSIMFPAWVWTRMPSARVICGSYTYALAMELSRKCRDVIRCDKYRKCFPEVELSESQDTKGFYANTLGGMRYSIGVGGALVGFHAHILVVDDPLDPAGATSDADIKATNDWMNDTLPSRKVDKAVTPIILIEHRLHQNDPAGFMLAKASDSYKVRHICLPAEETDHIKPASLRKYYKHGLLDPKRLPRSVLDEARMQGEFVFASQYLQHPVPLGGGMFKVDRLKYGIPPEKFREIVRFWDKAGTASGRGAFTVGFEMGVDLDGRFWILDVRRGRWDSFEREQKIKNTANEDGRSVIVGLEQEPGSGGKESAQSTTRNLAGYRVKVIKPTGDKALRADPFSSQVNAGNVYVKEGAAWIRDLVEEMRYFPASTFKDQVDAASGAFSLLTKSKIKLGGLGRKE